MSSSMTITASSAHSPTFPSLHLRHNSFSNTSVALPTSQFILQPSFASPTSQAELILQPFRHFTYVTTHSPTLPLLHLRNSSFSNLSATSLTSQLIIQPFRRFTYVAAHSPTFPLLLRHSSFSNPSFASPMSQAELILQPFRHFTYVKTHSPTLLSLYLRQRSFSNPSVALPMSQFILQPFFRFSYATSSSLNSPGEPPME